MTDRLDEFSKDLARGTTRREALRRIGAAIAGAMLAATGLDRATAAPSRCAVFCSQFPAGPRRASCMQACSKCKGQVSRICFTETGAICCPQGGHCCVDQQTGVATCCPNTQQCCGGSCCEGGCCFDPETGEAFCCPSGHSCCGGSCCEGGGCCFDYQTNQYLCCPDSSCCYDTPQSGAAFCCPSGQSCCYDYYSNSYYCAETCA
jgi:hypothetical protein